MAAQIDLRSDTVTRPTPEMRQAMANAEVGDDVFGDDPSVNRLQDQAAALLGMEAALFTPSGTMSNSIAIKTHTSPGDELLLDTEAHSMLYELGLPAVIANVLTRQFRSNHGVPDPKEIAGLIHEENLHSPGTALLMLENTHNRAGGAIIPLEVHRELYQLTRERGLRLHIDGARLFNAVAATGVSVREYAACADSVTFCLSKGLGCPVGSVLCGSHDFIRRARRIRKLLGGGMRQAGILAAAGSYALEHHLNRLSEDHENARLLAEGLQDIHGISLERPVPVTNMVYFDTTFDAVRLVDDLKTMGLLCAATGPNRIRLVTHLDVSKDDVLRSVARIRKAAAAIMS